MSPYLRAIAWAQFCTVKNHLRASKLGVWPVRGLVAVWYGCFCAVGTVAAMLIAHSGIALLRAQLPHAFLIAFLMWQWLPLLTLNAGWSLQLSKLRIYPVPSSAFFAIEFVLRLLAAPEITIVAIATAVGLLLNKTVPLVGVFAFIAYAVLNLLLTWIVRQLLLSAFSRNRFRELMAVAVVSIAVVPQLLLHSPVGYIAKPYFERIAAVPFLPWAAFAALTTGLWSAMAFLSAALWLAASAIVVHVVFLRSLREEELFHDASTRGKISGPVFLPRFPGRDPVAALVEKELRSLLRMPRFRVILGMSTVFSFAIFLSFAFGIAGSDFVRKHYTTVAGLYGLVLLGDTLLWNIFGFDRSAAQIYFAAPLALRTSFVAKNIVAALFTCIQLSIVLLLAVLMRMPLGLNDVLVSVLATLAVGLFFAGIGNLSSVTIPRPIDPNQTMRKQAGGQLQLWMLGCLATMLFIVGFAFLAGWALNAAWAVDATLAIEVAAGSIFYWVALDSAIAKGQQNRERIITALSSSSSPVAS